MEQRHDTTLADEHIGRLLLKFSLPAFIGMFVMTLYNVVDTIFIGHYVGPLGIAGLSIVFPVQMLAMGIGQMTGMGGASLISRLLGAGNVARAERTLGNAAMLTIILSAVITVVGLSSVDFWLRLMGSSETILPYARDYMSIILIGTFFGSSSMSHSSLIRAQGNARVPMLGMIAGAGLNIVLDAVFIIALDMGISGAALATVISMALTFVYFMIFSLSARSSLKFHAANLVLEMKLVRDILAIGVAAFAMTIATSLSGVAINHMLVAYGGDIAVSAFGILHRILMFALIPGIVIGTGLQPILGYNYGARRFGLALKAIRLAALVATAASLFVFLVLYFFPEFFVRIFSADTDLIALATFAIKRVFIALFLLGFCMVGSIVFQSIGKATQSFITSVSRPALFLIPLILIMPQFLGLDGVWLAIPISDVLTFILTTLLLIPQIREFQRLAKETPRL